MIVLVTGASGFIGTALTAALEQRGDEVYRLTRPPRLARSNEIMWNPSEGFLDKSKLRVCDAVVHLAGENIFGRWTRAKKRRIYQSRVQSSELLVDYIEQMDRRPRVLISASGAGYYGEQGDSVLTEDAHMGDGFLPEVARDREAACYEAEKSGVRTVQLRLGMVLGHGGALAKMLPAFSLNLGGPLGSGRQYMPWVALDDVVKVILFCMERGRIRGPVNVVSPDAVTNLEFSLTLARALHRKCFLRAPACMLRAVFGQLADELLLCSTRAVPQKLLNAGYEFQFPQLAPCLEAVLHEDH